SLDFSWPVKRRPARTALAAKQANAEANSVASRPCAARRRNHSQQSPTISARASSLLSGHLTPRKTTCPWSTIRGRIAEKAGGKARAGVGVGEADAVTGTISLAGTVPAGAVQLTPDRPDRRCRADNRRQPATSAGWRVAGPAGGGWRDTNPLAPDDY